MIAARPDVPGLGNHDPVRQHRIGGDLGEQRRIGGKPRAARHDGCEIEAKAIDAAAADEVAQAIERQRAHRRVGEIERVAAPRVVDQAAIGGMGIGGIIEPAQRQHPAIAIAFAAMVEHQIKDHADPRRVQSGDRPAQFIDPAGAQPRIERHERHRIIAPGIAKPQRPKMPFIDPGGDRHQLDRRHLQPLQMREHRRFGKRRDRAAQRWRNIRVAQGKTPHVDFVNQPAAIKIRRCDLWRRVGAGHQRSWHQMRRVHAELRQCRMLDEAPVKRDGIGIDQQFGLIEPQALFGRPFAFGTIAIGGTGTRHRQRDSPVIAVAPHGDALLGLRLEQA